MKEVRHLDRIENDFERAVFLANYNSAKQRLLRLVALLMIAAKHGLRGLLYVWPLAILVFVDFPGAWDWLRVALLLLAVAAWSRFIYGSVRDDYQRFVYGLLLQPGELRRVL